MRQQADLFAADADLSVFEHIDRAGSAGILEGDLVARTSSTRSRVVSEVCQLVQAGRVAFQLRHKECRYAVVDTQNWWWRRPDGTWSKPTGTWPPATARR